MKKARDFVTFGIFSTTANAQSIEYSDLLAKDARQVTKAELHEIFLVPKSKILPLLVALEAALTNQTERSWLRLTIAPEHLEELPPL